MRLTNDDGGLSGWPVAADIPPISAEGGLRRGGISAREISVDGHADDDGNVVMMLRGMTTATATMANDNDDDDDVLLHKHMHIHIYVNCICVCMQACVHVCTCICVDVYTYVCM